MSGYTLARVRFEIILAPDAVEQLRSLPAHIRSKVRDALEVRLRNEPKRVSRSRILQHHPEFLERIRQARAAVSEGRGVRLEDVAE